MKLKSAHEITDLFYNKLILDCEFEDQASRLNFLVKDTSYEGDLDNKLTLIILDADTGYVVNNNLKFNSVEIRGKEIIIYYMFNKKRKEFSHYYFK